jgi:branched-chain amino acid aminotransferase
MELARAAGVEVREQDITTFDLYAADECFLTGTAAELIAVVKIDGRTIGDGKPGPCTARLLELFREETVNNAG